MTSFIPCECRAGWVKEAGWPIWLWRLQEEENIAALSGTHCEIECFCTSEVEFWDCKASSSQVGGRGRAKKERLEGDAQEIWIGVELWEMEILKSAGSLVDRFPIGNVDRRPDRPRIKGSGSGKA